MRNFRKIAIRAPLIVVTLSIGLNLSSGFAAAEMKDAQEAFMRADYQEAYRQSLPEAERGNAAAQSMIGSLYAYGRGVPKDDSQAFHWFKRAADQGDLSAQYAVSQLYETGRGVERDTQAAVHWLKKAAEGGFSVAQLSLAHHYREGVGVPQDREQASYWEAKSAQDPANGIVEGALDRAAED
ncbi:tetratricopeptide repeat protein [Ensifer adhaerens]|uniref:tetratricopeptide repeat protein n=1 Tax=Ensifer adhaerens TaxID=106592 RepID=UPI0015C3AF3B|nr:tetratricopeptide repeat protein [Ensifer adhaerens]